MAEKEQSDNEITEKVINIKDYAKRMLKTDYDIICQSLLPNDIYLFTEKYINGKTDKELNLKPYYSKILKEKLIKVITSYSDKSIDGISEAQLLDKVTRAFSDEKRNLLLAIIVDLYIDDLIYKQKDF